MGRHPAREGGAVIVGLVVAVSAWQNGSSLLVTLGAGLLGAAVYYLVSGWVSGK